MSILDDIAAVASYAQRYETYLAIVCPYHQDTTPSLMVYEDWFRCLSCGQQGRPETLLRKLEGKPQRARTTRRFANPWKKWITAYGSLQETVMFAHDVLKSTPIHRQYLIDRRIDWKRFYLGYLSGWYVIPIISEKRKLVGSVARAGKRVDSPSRYVAPKDQSSMLYVPDWKMMDQDEVWLTFGIFDAITLCQLGKCGITVTTGKRVPVELLDGIQKRINILPDHGEEREAHELASRLGWRGKVIMLNYPYGTKDANDLLKTGQESILCDLR